MSAQRRNLERRNLERVRLVEVARAADTSEVTAVVVNYNQGALLEGAVRSVLAQTTAVREVMVVDDCSTDASAAVLDRLAPTVQVIRRATNGGVIAARNEALAHVSTPFVVFLDADDQLLPRFVERTLDAWHRSRDRLGFVYSPARRLHVAPAGRLGRHRGYLLSRSFDATALALDNYVCNTALLLTEAVRAVGGYAPEMEQIGHEDWDLFLSLADHGWRGRLVPRPLFCYRIRAGSRNEASTRRWSDVREAIAARHPSAVPADPSTPARRFRDRAVDLSQWAFCGLDLLAWLAEGRGSLLQPCIPAEEVG